MEGAGAVAAGAAAEGGGPDEEGAAYGKGVGAGRAWPVAAILACSGTCPGT